MVILSIIVPVYNGEKTIKRCLYSLMNQTYKDIEIIIVDDGSTDDTLKILKAYQKLDERIKIITRENKGYGYSLNEGIKSAKGEWIGNCDADDKWSTEFAEKMINHADDNTDVVKCGWYDVYNKINLKDRPFIQEGEYNIQNLTQYDKFLVFAYQPSIWSAIYRRDFLLENNIWFLETPGASFQDTAFTFKVWLNCKKAYFVEDRLCYYTMDNPNSSVKSKSKIYSVCDEYDEIERVCPDNLKPLMARLRVGTYMWNYNRLDEPEASQFLKKMQADFMKDLPYVESKYFNPIEWAEYKNVLEGI